MNVKATALAAEAIWQARKEIKLAFMKQTGVLSSQISRLQQQTWDTLLPIEREHYALEAAAAIEALTANGYELVKSDPSSRLSGATTESARVEEGE